ncbi:MAG: DNA-protecting protein DprA [Anaerolineales bacterium]|nr:DNA-protecting protein DprA [Anaerolineales bacterium]
MDTKAYWIAFNRVPGIGPVRLAALIEACGDIGAAWRASISQMQAARLDRRTIELFLEARRTIDLAVELQRTVDAGVEVLTWEDATYPESLRTVDGAPPVLYVRGRIVSQDEWAIAVVGTRHASSYGREVARVLGAALAQAGVTVVSGLALGIDTVAHHAALDAGGRTLAVLGSGVDQIYPPQNRGLAQAIAAQGALVSEYALGTRPDASNFPPRNRIISGLSRGVIIVEAGERSGALITARFAAEQGRELFAVPGSILSPGSAGCNTLIQQGAAPLLTIDDVLEQLNMSSIVDHQDVRQSVPADPAEAALLTHLSHEPSHVDDLVRMTAMTPSQVSSLLALMELTGLVRQVGVMTYMRA